MPVGKRRKTKASPKVTKAGYLVVNRKTGAVVSRPKTLKGARRAVDRLDNKYGGYVHTIKPDGKK